MKIRYLSGNRLYYAFLAGGDAVIRDKAYLNKINVFPVPDADTGTNLASTMRFIAARAKAFHSPKSTLDSIADAAISGARGNSGIIFAQFLYGIAQEIKNDLRISTKAFGESVRHAVRYARSASVQSLFTFLASHYKSVIAVTISSGLTGMYSLCLKAAESLPGAKISVIDAKPDFVMDLSPVIGVHNGIGVVGIALVHE